MTIYFFTILVLFAFSLIDINYELSTQTKQWLMLFIYLLLVVQVGLRWETGTDWNPYLSHFDSITDFTSTSPLTNGMEYGYDLFVFVSKLIWSNYSFFLLIHALIYYYLIFKSFNRYTPYFFVALLMFYTLSMGMMGSNRELLAFAICLYALRYVIEKKPIHFFLLLFVSINFHTSAFVFSIFYFLNRPLKPYSLLLILGITFIIGKTSIPFSLFSFVGNLIGGHAAVKTLSYLNSAEEQLQNAHLSMIGLLKKLVFLGFFYYNREKLREVIPYYTILLNGYIIGIAFYFLFSDTLLIMVSRGSFYFTMLEPLLLASQVCLFKGKLFKSIVIVILLIFAFLFFYQSISQYPDIFDPYKGLFINSSFSREMN